jgi:hypothetical protein
MIFSDSTPSMCALEYLTTPSLATSSALVSSTAMIEFAAMPGAIGSAANV